MANVYANFGNGTNTGYYAVAQWAALTAYSNASNGGRGDYVRQLATPAVGSERVFRCTTSGTSLASEPAWTLTKNGVTTETAGPVWTECTGQEADQVSGNWKAPHARIANALAATWSVAGGTVYVGKNHAETQATAETLTSPGTSANPVSVVCVDQTGSVPPVSADVQTTPQGTVTTTGANALTITGAFYISGLIFQCGTSGSPALTVTSTDCNTVLVNCSLQNLSASAQSLAIGQAGRTSIFFNNVTYQVGAIGSVISALGRLEWKNTPAAILGAVFPTNLFSQGTGSTGIVLMEGVDLSAMGSSKLWTPNSNLTQITLKDCKLSASFPLPIYNSSNAASYPLTYILRSDVSNNYQAWKVTAIGQQVVDATVVRTGGANDGVTSVSWKLTTTSVVNVWGSIVYEAIPVSVWNTVVGSAVNVTMEGIRDAATLPNNDDFWLDVEFLGSSSSPQGSFVTGTKANLIATPAALTASTQAWDSLVTARVNSQAYALGAAIKVATNVGRVFFCTTAGTSAGSEPAGYASAVDGGSVTDGTAVFRAGVRFKQTISVVPQMAGPITGYIKRVAANTFYIDPKLTLA